jgi:hypothetical protein
LLLRKARWKSVFRHGADKIGTFFKSRWPIQKIDLCNQRIDLCKQWIDLCKQRIDLCMRKLDL